LGCGAYVTGEIWPRSRRTVQYALTQMKLMILQISSSIPVVRVTNFSGSINGFKMALAIARSESGVFVVYFSGGKIDNTQYLRGRAVLSSKLE